MSAEAETVVVQRIESGLQEAAPGFDPLIITTMIELLMDLLSGMCGGDDITPEKAIEKAGNLTRFQQAALRSRLARKAREKGVRDARKISGIAADVATNVAKSSTAEERLEFAKYLKPLASDELTFDIF